MTRKILIIAALIGAFSLTAFGSLQELLPEQLEDAKGNPVARDTLEGKIIGLYFSAAWCPPCRAFTPDLVKFRNGNKEDFEVVFVSRDRTPEAQRKYMADYNMDFLTLEHNSEWTNLLGRKYEIRGIPALIIVDSNGKLISRNGRQEVGQNPRRALAEWQKQANRR